MKNSSIFNIEDYLYQRKDIVVDSLSKMFSELDDPEYKAGKDIFIFINIEGTILSKRYISRAKNNCKSVKPEYIVLDKTSLSGLRNIRGNYFRNVVIYGAWGTAEIFSNFQRQYNYKCYYIPSTDDFDPDKIFEKYMEVNGVNPNYIIIDNEDDGQELKKKYDNRCILCDSIKGMSKEDFELAKFILSL